MHHLHAQNSKNFLGRGPSPLPHWGGGHPSPSRLESWPSATRSSRLTHCVPPQFFVASAAPAYVISTLGTGVTVSAISLVIPVQLCICIDALIVFCTVVKLIN